jgi:hypothetical protein
MLELAEDLLKNRQRHFHGGEKALLDSGGASVTTCGPAANCKSAQCPGAQQLACRHVYHLVKML